METKKMIKAAKGKYRLLIQFLVSTGLIETKVEKAD